MGDIINRETFDDLQEALVEVNLSKKESEIIKTQTRRETKRVGKKFFFFDKYKELTILELIILDDANYIAKLLTDEVESVEVVANRFVHMYSWVEIKRYQNGVLLDEKRI